MHVWHEIVCMLMNGTQRMKNEFPRNKTVFKTDNPSVPIYLPIFLFWIAKSTIKIVYIFYFTSSLLSWCDSSIFLILRIFKLLKVNFEYVKTFLSSHHCLLKKLDFPKMTNKLGQGSAIELELQNSFYKTQWAHAQKNKEKKLIEKNSEKAKLVCWVD